MPSLIPGLCSSPGDAEHLAVGDLWLLMSPVSGHDGSSRNLGVFTPESSNVGVI